MLHSQRDTTRTPRRPAPLPALATLQSKRRWVCWQYESNSSGKKPKKEPYNAARPAQKASTKNPHTWCNYRTAIEVQQRYGFDGIGFVAGDGISFVDLDNCLDEAGQPNDEARRIVALLDSYTEVSPSGKGLKILVYGTVPENIGAGASVEIYSAGQYTTITGKHVAGTPTEIRPSQAALEALHAEYRHAKRESHTTTPHEHIDWPEADVRRYSKHLALLLDKSGIPARLAAHSQARLALTDLPKLLDDKPWLVRWLARNGNDTNASMQRAIVAHGLRTYAGYDFAPFAALMWYLFADKPEHNTRAGRNSRWWQGEITRLWNDAKPAAKGIYAVRLPDDTEAPALPTPAAAPAKAPAPRGRPKIKSSAAYLDWLKSQADAHTNVVMKSTSEIAALLGVSRRTIQNYEAKLRGDGAIERRAYANRQAGCVFILDLERGAKNTTVAAQQAENEAISTSVHVVKAHAAIALPDAANSEPSAHDKDTRGYLARRATEPATLEAGQPNTQECSASVAQHYTRVSLEVDNTAASDEWDGVLDSAAAWLADTLGQLQDSNAAPWLVEKCRQQLAAVTSTDEAPEPPTAAHGALQRHASERKQVHRELVRLLTPDELGTMNLRAMSLEQMQHELAQRRASTDTPAPEPAAPAAPTAPPEQQALFDLPAPNSKNAVLAIAA